MRLALFLMLSVAVWPTAARAQSATRRLIPLESEPRESEPRESEPRVSEPALALGEEASAPSREPSVDARADELSPAPKEVQVLGLRPLRPATGMSLTGARASQVPGTQGDAAKAVQSLPGVLPAGAEGEPAVVGSSARETGIFVDSVPLPFLFHGSGFRSVLPADWLGALSVTPAGYGVDLGRHLGGVVQLTTSEPDAFERHWDASVDTLDVAAAVSSPLGARSAARASARYGYGALWMKALERPGSSGLLSFPTYWDAHAQWALSLPQGSWKVQLLSAHDEAEQEQRPDSPWGVTRHRARNLNRLYAVYSDSRNAAVQSTVTPHLGWDTSRETIIVGGRRAERTARTWLGGLRLEQRRLLSKQLSLMLGIDAAAESEQARHDGSLTVPPREGDDRAFALPLGPERVVDEVQVLAVQVAPFLRLDWQSGPLTWSPGLRVEASSLETDNASPSVGDVPDAGTTRISAFLAPRLGVSWDMSPRASLEFVASRHQQRPESLDWGEMVANPRLPPGQAWHLAMTERVSLHRSVSVEVSVFSKWLSQLAARTQEAQPERGAVLTADGRGRSVGALLTARVRGLGGVDGWLTATVSRSERRDCELCAWRLFDEDRAWMLTAVLNRSWGPWTFGTRLSVTEGAPRKAVVAADFDLIEQRFDPVFSATYRDRLPVSFSWDLRAERAWELAPQRDDETRRRSLVAYAELLNVTNHSNVEERAYSFDYRSWEPVRGLPTTLMAGMRVSL